MSRREKKSRLSSCQIIAGPNPICPTMSHDATKRKP
jgi:hypothetical protein